jgi:hypothetical protein
MNEVAVPATRWLEKKSLFFHLVHSIVTLATIFATLTLVMNTYRLVHGEKATPKGDLRLTIVELPNPGSHAPDDADWSTPTDSVASQFVGASNTWAERLQKQVPDSWKVAGPYAWDGGSYSYASSQPSGTIAVSKNDIPGRWRLWVPTLLSEALIAIGLFLTSRMFYAILTRGPFDPRVYRYLLAVALIGLVGTLVVSVVHVHLFNDFYDDLDLGRFGVYAKRSDPSGYAPVWLAALGMVQILRYGSQLQRESNETV